MVIPRAQESTIERAGPTPTRGSNATVEAGREEITIEQRTKVLDNLASFRAALSGEDPEADKQALVDYMTSCPEFEAAGIIEGVSVWGRFTDGRLVIFADKPKSSEIGEGTGVGRSPIASGQELPALFSSRPGRPGKRGDQALNLSSLQSERAQWMTSRQTGVAASPLAPASGGLPSSGSAVVVSALDPPAWPSEELELRNWLTEKGYEVQSFSPTVDALKTGVKGVGVLYFDTHGGCGLISGRERLCSLKTRTPQTPENDIKYERDLRENRLLYMGDGLGSSYNYGVTDFFVSEYMSFSQDSFAYMAACHSYNPGMALGFQYAGASVLAGWLGAVGGECDANAAKTTFDLLLGMNDYWVEEPPFRPFDYATVWEYLRETGKDTCGNAKLMFEKLGGNFAVLAPSIKNMEVYEGTGPVPVVKEVGTGELTLHGIFGLDPGDDGLVTIDGSPVEIETWEPERIVVRLPSAKTRGGAGDVVVTVRDHRSNDVPLTRWHGTFHYTVERHDDLCTGAGKMSQRFAFDIYLRADVHPYREKPGQEPIRPERVSFRAAQDSSAGWSFEGACRFLALQGPGADIQEWCTTEQSGSGEWGVCTREDIYGFSFYGSIDAESQTLEASFRKTANEPQDFWGSLGATLTTECDGLDDVVEQEPADWLLPLLIKTSDTTLRSMTLTIDDRYTILGESRDLEPYDTWIEGVLHSSLHWENISAEHPPEDDTQAAVPTGWAILCE
jgi:hypothetical protein